MQASSSDRVWGKFGSEFLPQGADPVQYFGILRELEDSAGFKFLLALLEERRRSLTRDITRHAIAGRPDDMMEKACIHNTKQTELVVLESVPDLVRVIKEHCKKKMGV